MQPTDTKYLIDELLASDTFKNKEVLKGLLQFLYKSYLKQKELKEIDIACDYFKREKTFVPGDDTIVRVNIYKLRQLLKSYYDSEGKANNIRISIPKGAYFLVFDSPVKENPWKSRKRVAIILTFTVLVISLLANLVLIFSSEEQKKIDYHPVWKDYNNDVRPISIILGNPLFYASVDKDSNKIICRNLQINNPVDSLIEKKPAINYPYFSANNVMPLLSVFNSLKRATDIELQPLSEINPEHVRSNNQIFIANINSFGFYSSFLKETSIRISINPRKIILISEKDTTYFSVPEKSKGYHDDYAFFVKMPGPNNNIISLMGDFHASGNIGVTNMFLDESKMKDLANYVLKKYERFPRFFEMIVKVSSYEHTDLETSIIYFNEIEHESSSAIYFPETFY